MLGMIGRAAALGCLLGTAAALGQHAPAPGKPAQAKADPMERGLALLKKLQRPDGGWDHPERVGLTALAGLTLLECGTPPDDPAVQKAAKLVRRHAPVLCHTYSLSLAVLFLNRLDQPEDGPL